MAGGGGGGGGGGVGGARNSPAFAAAQAHAHAYAASSTTPQRVRTGRTPLGAPPLPPHVYGSPRVGGGAQAYQHLVQLDLSVHGDAPDELAGWGR